MVVRTCCAHCVFLSNKAKPDVDWFSQWRNEVRFVCTKRKKSIGSFPGVAYTEHKCVSFAPRTSAEILADTLAERWR